MDAQEQLLKHGDLGWRWFKHEPLPGTRMLILCPCGCGKTAFLAGGEGPVWQFTHGSRICFVELVPRSYPPAFSLD